MQSPSCGLSIDSAPPTVAGRHAASLRNQWRDGARCAFLLRFDGERERGGYPKGFHRWPLDRRNAWFAGFNCGFHDRLRLAREAAE